MITGQITQFTAKRMFYTGFAEHITTQFGVVIENWPLPRFVAPSSMRTRIELSTLMNAWENNMTRFRKLTREEWEKWQLQQTDPDAGEAPDAIRAVTLACWITPAPANAEGASEAPGGSSPEEQERGAQATPITAGAFSLFPFSSSTLMLNHHGSLSYI